MMKRAALALLLAGGLLLSGNPSQTPNGGGAHPAVQPQSSSVKAYHAYDAEVLDVIDGDTVDLKVSLGFGLEYTDRFRFYGINAWEKRGEEKAKGIIARDFLKSQIPQGTQVRIRTVVNRHGQDSRGKYGRYLVQDLRTSEGDYGNTNLLEVMVKEGHAEVKHY